MLVWSSVDSGYIFVFEVSSLVVVIKNHVRTQKTCQCRVYAAAEWPQANFSIKCMTNNKYFFIHLQIFFINLQLCPAVVSGSETSLLSTTEYRENWMGKWESRWCREIQIMNMNLDGGRWSNPMVLACGYQHSLQKMYKHGNQEHHSMCPDHWSIYFCTL